MNQTQTTDGKPPDVQMPPILIDVRVIVYANQMMRVQSRNSLPEIIYALESAKQQILAQPPAGTQPTTNPRSRLWTPGG